MTKETRLSVVAAVWPWNVPVVSPSIGSAARCRRAWIQGLAIAGIATAFMWVWHRYWIGLFLYGMSALVLVAGLLVPPLFHALDRFGRWLGQCVGVGLTWLLLAPFFYLCMVPGRLLLKILGKDPLQRPWDRGRTSYWTDRKPRDPQSYTRQY